jgi:3-hydroxybutyrate dehydrogenase
MPKAPHVVVNGGAAAISVAVARRFKSEGYRVTMMGKNLQDLDPIADEIKAYAVRIDVCDPASVETAFMQAGPVDVLVNCAVIARASSTLRTDVRVWEEHLKVNLTSAFLCSLKVLPGMLKRSRGAIINVPILFSPKNGTFLGGVYASMYGLIGFTRSLAAEYSTNGIRINAVCPSCIDSTETEELAVELSELHSVESTTVLEGFREQSGNRDLLDANVVADVIFRLTTEEGSELNGEFIPVDGSNGDLERRLEMDMMH